jgi:hypothetical protein
VGVDALRHQEQVFQYWQWQEGLGSGCSPSGLIEADSLGYAQPEV